MLPCSKGMLTCVHLGARIPFEANIFYSAETLAWPGWRFTISGELPRVSSTLQTGVTGDYYKSCHKKSMHPYGKKVACLCLFCCASWLHPSSSPRLATFAARSGLIVT